MARVEEALDALSDISQNNDNGDIFYLLSRIYELVDDSESQKDYLELALENKDTLTFDFVSVKNELKELEELSNVE